MLTALLKRSIPFCHKTIFLQSPSFPLAQVASKFCTFTPQQQTELEAEYKTELNDIEQAIFDRRAQRGMLEGFVVSDKCQKSIVVQVISRNYVPKYHAYRRSRSRIMAHDEEELASEGDYVRIVPSRPMSRKKRHKLFEIVKKAGVV